MYTKYYQIHTTKYNFIYTGGDSQRNRNTLGDESTLKN